MSLNPQPTGLVIELQKGLDLSAVGAKSANLGKAMENGFPVPPGFVVTRDALSLFLEQSGLGEDLQSLLDRPAGLSHSERTEAHQAFSQKLLATPIPQSLIEAVAPFADALFARATCGLAARSSSIYEDSATASFAGVYESFLGIHSLEALWTSIQKCWCSAWAPSALDYAHKMGIEPEPDGMAVLVQPLLAADSAGVLFTADPQTGNPWRFVLESTFGLAQELLGSSGTFAPDRFVFAWDSGEILERHLGEKTRIWQAGPDGVQSAALPAARHGAFSLSDETAGRIARLALQVDRAFGGRIDIEWVLVRDEVHLVQVRPLTALPAFFPHYLPRHARDHTWVLVPQWHFAHRMVQGKLMPPLYRDLSIVEKDVRYHRVGPIEMPAQCHAGAEMDFNGYRYQIRDFGWACIPLGGPLEQREAFLVEYEARLRRDYLDGIKHRRPALAEEAIRLRRQASSVSTRIDAILWARDASFDLFSVISPGQVLTAVCNRLLQDFIERHLPGCEMADLLQGHHPDITPYYQQAQVEAAEKLADAVDDRQAFMAMDLSKLIVHLAAEKADAPFILAFERYCDDMGLTPPNRSAVPADGWQRYRDILHLVRGAIRAWGRDTRKVQEEAASRRQVALATARQTLEAKKLDQLPRFERLLDWAYFWGPALNDRGWAGLTVNELQDLVDAMCHGLQQDGLIDTEGDLGYFTAEDLIYIAQTQDIAEGRRIWEQRRREYEHNARLAPPDHLGKAPKVRPPQPAQPTRQGNLSADPTVLVQGKGAVPGKNSGRARRIYALDEADTVDAGEVVLFAESSQVFSGDTPTLLSLTLRASGMVCLEGPFGLMYHLAQVARECGVPIVLVSPTDMRRIPEGARLELDGKRGTVKVC